MVTCLALQGNVGTTETEGSETIASDSGNRSNRRPNGSHGQLPKRMGKFIGFESRRLHWIKSGKPEVKTMPSGKSSSDQKVDDLERHVDKLSESIDSSRKEILQAIKDEDSSIEDKINALPTKKWVEK